MFYVKSSIGEEVSVTNTNVFTRCPKCGAEHKIDLVSLIIEHGEDCTGDILDSTMYCEECSKKHLPVWENMDQIEFLASQFPNVEVGEVVELVKTGLDHGVPFETALIGARLALATENGAGLAFMLDEVASAMGCTREATEAEMEQLGISPIKVSALPGFEWVLGKE